MTRLNSMSHRSTRGEECLAEPTNSENWAVVLRTDANLGLANAPSMDHSPGLLGKKS